MSGKVAAAGDGTPREQPGRREADLRVIRGQVERRVAEEAGGQGPGDGGGGADNDFVRQCLDASDLGDGTLFAHLFRGRFVFNHTSGTWLAWGGHSWRRDIQSRSLWACEDVALLYVEERARVEAELAGVPRDDQTTFKALERRCKFVSGRINHMRSVPGRRRCLEMAATCERPLSVEEPQIDARPELLAVANGVVDLTTGVLRPGRPEDWLLRSSPVPFDPDADLEPWVTFLWEVYEDQEKIDYIQRLVGMSLFGDSREHVLPVFWGKGRNGKDTLFDMLQYVLGDLAGAIQPEMLMDQGRNTRSPSGPSPEIMALKGIRMAVGSETEKGSAFALGKVKWLTGGGRLVGRGLQDKHMTTFDPSHTLFVLTNHKPRAGDDYALWKRLVLIGHPFSFVDSPRAPDEKQKDGQLKERLKDSAPGILRWMVEGALRYLDMGLRPPPCVLAETEDYRRDEDVLSQFLEARCWVSRELEAQFPGLEPDTLVEVETRAMRTPFKELYEAFEEWWQEFRGGKVPTQKSLGLMLKAKFPNEKAGGMFYFGVGVRSG
ncbi:MAG: phage/plasmid primase, P4 family [Desulfovibrionaceae bacterium]